ncbi:MAG: hypothetical protein GDA56_27675 [Hormoscilla sp. GM7CHS1pb]|nr:hypothetical protein [Hormoscilla sp. GM7CHS1pb]
MSDSLATDRTPSLISLDMLPYQSRTTGPLKLGVLASGNGILFPPTSVTL